MPMSPSTPYELKRANRVLAVAVVLLSLGFGFLVAKERGWLKTTPPTPAPTKTIASRAYVGDALALPAPKKIGKLSVEAAMQNRRSRRAYTQEPVTLAEVSQILWSLQGQTADWGGRTTPSAHSAYPLEVTIVAKNVANLPAGVYHYQSANHVLVPVITTVPASFDEAAAQDSAKNSPVVFYISGNFQKMTDAFKGVPHDEDVYLEVGHAGQNAYLQVESLGLGTVVMGGFNPAKMAEVLKIPTSEKLIYQIPVGHPSEE